MSCHANDLGGAECVEAVHEWDAYVDFGGLAVGARAMIRSPQALRQRIHCPAVHVYMHERGPGLRRAWQEVIPFFGFDPAIRKIIYTTNAIESLNRVIRKSIKTRGSFPTDEAATKLIYLAIRKFEKDRRNAQEWFAARNQFAIMFGERFDA